MQENVDHAAVGHRDLRESDEHEQDEQRAAEQDRRRRELLDGVRVRAERCDDRSREKDTREGAPDASGQEPLAASGESRLKRQRNPERDDSRSEEEAEL